MRAYVGVTDGKWYGFLAARPEINEVNFWRPSGDRAFKRLAAGEPFFFKTHYPHNRVVGGGFFSGFARLPMSEAWEFFGEWNGVGSLEEMRRQVGQYRRRPIGPGEDPVIGCIMVRDTTFFPPDETADPPPDFASNIVQGKGYDLADHSSASYFEGLLARVLGSRIEIDLGQGSFKAVVLDAYRRRCAITGGRIRPVLQAAHIRPVTKGGEHRLDNGLLLRSDVHTLYDQGYLGVDPRHRLLVSSRLREEFQNGDKFYAMVGESIAVPERAAERPSPEFLEWHLDTVFKR